MTTIEIPKGSRVKYEIDHETGRVRLDRVLFTSMQYPTHHGFFGTPSAKTDPLDALVLLQDFTCTPASSLVPPHRRVQHDRRRRGRCQVLWVPADDRFDHINQSAMSASPSSRKSSLLHPLKDLEPGKWVKAEGWGDRAAAEAELEASIKRYVPHTH